MLQPGWPQGTLSSVQPKGTAWSPPGLHGCPRGSCCLTQHPPIRTSEEGILEVSH